MKHVLVVASTFPSKDDDPVPAFVKDQIIAFKKNNNDLKFTVLAPHDFRSKTKNYTRHKYYDEFRFHYIWPFQAEKLAGRGIMPALKANPLNYLLIPFLFIGEFMMLLDLTKSLKPDVIYAHWFTPQAVIASWVSRLTGVPFVFTTHASDVAVWNKIPFGRLIVKNSTKKAKAITAVSGRSMKKLENFFNESEFKKLNTKIIPMGVDLPKVQLSTSEGYSILFLGRLAEKKGVKYLIDAFAGVKKENPKAKLVIAGDGPLLGDLKDQVQSLKLKDVEFAGYVAGKDKNKYIEQANLYVVPSIIAESGDAEGLPVSLMEGLAYGKICIATNESGADDIITDEKDGFLVSQKDVDGLKKTILKAFELNKEEKSKIKKEAQKTAQQFSWDRIAKEHEEFLFEKSNV